MGYEHGTNAVLSIQNALTLLLQQTLSLPNEMFKWSGTNMKDHFTNTRWSSHNNLRQRWVEQHYQVPYFSDDRCTQGMYAKVIGQVQTSVVSQSQLSLIPS